MNVKKIDKTLINNVWRNHCFIWCYIIVCYARMSCKVWAGSVLHSLSNRSSSTPDRHPALLCLRISPRFCGIYYTLLIPCGKLGPPYLGKATAASRAALPNPTSACWVFSCFRHPSNSDMDYRIFNVRTWSFLYTGVGHTLPWDRISRSDTGNNDTVNSAYMFVVECARWQWRLMYLSVQLLIRSLLPLIKAGLVNCDHKSPKGLWLGLIRGALFSLGVLSVMVWRWKV